MHTNPMPMPMPQNPRRRFRTSGKSRRYDWETLIASGCLRVCHRKGMKYAQMVASFRLSARVQGLAVEIRPCVSGGLVVRLVGRVNPTAKGYKSPRFRAEIAAQEAAAKLAP